MLEIRKAELKDLETLVEFSTSMAFETENKRLAPEIVLKGVRTLLENPKKGTYYLAEIDGQAAGCLMTNPQWIDWQATTIFYIQSVYTKPEFRGRGVFKALYNHVLNETRTQGLALRLYADNTNLRAIEVYKRLGMAEVNLNFLEVDFAFS